MDSREELLRRAQAGDAQAFCRVVEAHLARLFRQALTLCRDCHLAEDLAQETLLEAWKNIATYNWRCRFSTWLYSILLHRYKKSARKSRLIPIPASSLTDGSEAKAPADDQEAEGAFESAQRSEESALLHAAVEKLPEEMRDVIALRFFAHASLEDISEALGIPLGTVKSRLHYGLEKLRSTVKFK